MDGKVLDVPLFLLRFAKKTSPKTSDAKVFMVSRLRRGPLPFVYRTMHKKQLIRSVRLLNSAGGVYFVIAAVPMSL